MEPVEDVRANVAEIKAVIAAIVRALVDHPDEVVVTEIEGTQSCVLELKVAAADVGKVIGRKGIHADALRRIVHAIGGKHRRRYVLEILEEHALAAGPR
jgi:predicted RNA-binding protein YlqC (UPF0109 family)